MSRVLTFRARFCLHVKIKHAPNKRNANKNQQSTTSNAVFLLLVFSLKTCLFTLFSLPSPDLTAPVCWCSSFDCSEPFLLKRHQARAASAWMIIPNKSRRVKRDWVNRDFVCAFDIVSLPNQKTTHTNRASCFFCFSFTHSHPYLSFFPCFPGKQKEMMTDLT